MKDNQLAVPQATQRTNLTFFEHRCVEPGVESMVNNNVGGIGSRYVGSNVGGSVSGDMLFEMSSHAWMEARSGVS